MKTIPVSVPLGELEELARKGTGRSVAALMKHLTPSQSGFMCSKIGYSLGLVESQEGVKAVCHYLFNGTQMQRNYAALYFKRRGDKSILSKAVSAGCIDKIQAFSR